MRFAEAGIAELQKVVDTLLIIPNQNLFRVANEKTTFADAFAMADQVLYSGVACITDLMVKEGLINLDFADVRAVMREMGKAMMGTGEASGEKRALTAAEAAISNPLIDDASMKGAKGLLISITGGKDLTLYEVDEAATRIREEVDQRRQHHRRRDLRREPRRHHPRLGGGDRHRQGTHRRISRRRRRTRVAGARRQDALRKAPAHRRAHRARRRTGAHGRGSQSAAHAAGRRGVDARRRAAIEDVTIRPMPMKPSLFDAVPARAGRDRRAGSAQDVHPAAPERAAARAAHAAHRRTADAGPERDPGAARPTRSRTIPRSAACR